MSYLQTWKRRREKKYRILYKRGPSTLALIFAGMALALWGMFVILSSYPVGLYLYYTVMPSTSQLLAKALSETGKVKISPDAPVVEATSPTAVQKDISLPEGHYLEIPKIGVDTVIWESPSSAYETALKRGVWRVPDFGEPAIQGKPTILAAHRFGYLEWTQQYRLKNSFYNLPKLVGGDQIAMVYDQHRYLYRVERVVEGDKIDDYQADLILYTCKFVVSPVRIFVYAKRIN